MLETEQRPKLRVLANFIPLLENTSVHWVSRYYVIKSNGRNKELVFLDTVCTEIYNPLSTKRNEKTYTDVNCTSGSFPFES